MVVRHLLISCGQSNETPIPPLANYLAYVPQIDLDYVTSLATGGAGHRFVMPGNFPGFAELPLKGVAIRGVRYLTFYNPSCTGYKTYPCVGRLAAAGSHTTTRLFVEQTFQAGTHPLSIVRQRTGTVHTVTAISNSSLPAGCGSDLTLDAATPWPDVVNGEQFDYTVKVTAGTGTAALTLNLTFGLGFGTTVDGALTGLVLRCVVGANAGQHRIIKGWVNSTRVATLESAFTSAIASTDQFVIAPQTGTFENFGLWLPWSPYEAGDGPNKINPYPPGFNYPNHWSIPQLYKYDATRVPKVFTVSSVPTSTFTSVAHGMVDGTPVRFSTTGSLPAGLVTGLTFYVVESTADTFRVSLTLGGTKFTIASAGTGTHTVTYGNGIVPKQAAYHIGLAVQLQEMLGQDIYVLTAGVGGTPLGYSEVGPASGDVGWFDPAANTCWSSAEANNCFARMLRQIDAGIAAAEAVGDTLEVVACVFPQGETDALVQGYADNYLQNIRELKSRLRAELKARGLWPRSATTIPFVHPKILSTAWPLAPTVNAAIETAAEEDRAGRTFEVDDIDQSAAHYSGKGLPVFSQRALEAIKDIRRATDPAGEIEICNQALQHIGDAGEVTSIDPPDGSAQAAACAKSYPKVRDALIESHAWGFATKRRALQALTSNTPVWQYAYLLPGDVATVLAVQPADAQSDHIQPNLNGQWWPSTVVVPPYGAKVPQDYAIEQDELGRRVIYSNQINAVIRYIAWVTDTRRFTRLFAEALGWKLAAELAIAIVRGDQGAKQAKECLRMFALTMGKAEQQDSQQSQGQPTHVPSWIAGMH